MRLCENNNGHLDSAFSAAAAAAVAAAAAAAAAAAGTAAAETAATTGAAAGRRSTGLPEPASGGAGDFYGELAVQDLRRL